MNDNYQETQCVIHNTIERLNALKMNNNSKFKPCQQYETNQSQQQQIYQTNDNFQAISVKTSFYPQSKNFDSNAYNYNETQNPQNQYQTIDHNTIQTNQQQIELKLDNLKESIHFNIQESYDLNSYIMQKQLIDSTEIEEHLDEQLQKPKESEIQNIIKSKIQNQSIQKTNEKKSSQNNSNYMGSQSLVTSNSKINVNDNFNTLTYKQQFEINQFF